jgi:predicted RNase H-like HicB family nuclease
MQFEVEVHKNEMGGWVAVAVDWDVKAVGRTESEALALLMEALAQHFKASAKK